MLYKIVFRSCWSQALSIILKDLQPFKLRNYSKTKKIKFVPITTITYRKTNLEHFEHDTNLNTLSTQTPRGQELLVHIKKIGKSK